MDDLKHRSKLAGHRALSGLLGNLQRRATVERQGTLVLQLIKWISDDHPCPTARHSRFVLEATARSQNQQRSAFRLKDAVGFLVKPSLDDGGMDGLGNSRPVVDVYTLKDRLDRQPLAQCRNVESEKRGKVIVSKDKIFRHVPTVEAETIRIRPGSKCLRLHIPHVNLPMLLD